MRRVLVGVMLFGLAGCPKGAPPADVPVALVNRSGSAVPWKVERQTLVVFATTWCASCKRERPALARWAEAERDVDVVLIFSGSAAPVVDALLRKEQFAPERVRVLVDERGGLARRFDVAATPTLVLLSADGERVGTWTHLDEVTLPSSALLEVRDGGSELGTSYDVLVLARNRERAELDLAAVRSEVHRLEGILSEWQPDSELSSLSRSEETWVEVSDPLARVLSGALHVAEVTGGAYDPTWLPLGELWDAAERSGEVPTPDVLGETLERVGFERVEIAEGRVRLAPGTQLGLGGVAKGWIVDAVAHGLRERGYRRFVVNLGGDLRTSGRDATGARWQFQIADPWSPERAVTSLDLEDVAVATSGQTYRARTIGDQRIGHILDPRTGQPAAFEGSVTVVAEDAALADALATALFVMGPDEGLSLVRSVEGLEAVFVTRSGVRSSL